MAAIGPASQPKVGCPAPNLSILDSDMADTLVVAHRRLELASNLVCFFGQAHQPVHDPRVLVCGWVEE